MPRYIVTLSRVTLSLAFGEPGPTRQSRSDSGCRVSDFRGDVWESALAAVTILA
jgi:hypothetical protein